MRYPPTRIHRQGREADRLSGKAGELAITGLTLMNHNGGVERADRNVAAAGLSMVIATTTAALFSIRRNYDAVDIVIHAM